MTDAIPVMMHKVLLKEEADYIENMLKACDEDLTIKTYKVLRETSFERIVKEIDEAIENNPLYELAGQPLDIRFLNVEKWVAILVEYEDK